MMVACAVASMAECDDVDLSGVPAQAHGRMESVEYIFEPTLHASLHDRQ